MIETLSQIEAVPEAYPETPEGLSEGAGEIEAAFLWQRIEAWVAHRWSPRSVVWIVQGAGHWSPLLVPATATEVAVWREGWEAVSPPVSPLGGFVLARGHYRITATIGAGPVPAAAQEAFRRMAEYLAQPDPGLPGVRVYAQSIGNGAISENFQRSPAWIGRAMEWSGAADLLRPYRRA